jgi:hypothetical protein
MQLPSIFYDRNNFDWIGAQFTMVRTVQQNWQEEKNKDCNTVTVSLHNDLDVTKGPNRIH